MAGDIEIDFDIATGAAPAPRIPRAVWINRPAAAERGAVQPASVILGAVAIVGLAVFGTLVLRGEATVLQVSPVSPARADAAVETTGNGPTGYFPDAFGRVAGEIEPLPPTF